MQCIPHPTRGAPCSEAPCPHPQPPPRVGVCPHGQHGREAAVSNEHNCIVGFLKHLKTENASHEVICATHNLVQLLEPEFQLESCSEGEKF